jgi:hypothetical protein
MRWVGRMYVGGPGGGGGFDGMKNRSWGPDCLA